MDLKFPADMFDNVEAKGFIEPSRVCHRCGVTCSELGVMFDWHEVKHDDNLNIIAKRYGIDVHELRVINVELTADEEVRIRKYHQTQAETKTAEEEAEANKKKKGSTRKSASKSKGTSESSAKYKATIFKTTTSEGQLFGQLFEQPDLKILETLLP